MDLVLNANADKSLQPQKNGLLITSLFLTTLTTGYAVASPLAFYPAFLAQTNSIGTIGVVFWVVPLASLLTSGLWMVFANATSRLFVLHFGLVITGATTLAIPFVDSISLICLIRFIQGAGLSACSTSAFDLARQWFPETSSSVAAVLETGTALGATAGPAVGAALFAAADQSPRLAFLLPGALILAMLIIIPVLVFVAKPQRTTLEPLGVPLNLRLLRDMCTRPFVCSAVAIVLCEFALSSLEPVLGLHIVARLGATWVQTGLAYSLIPLSYALAQSLTGRVAKRLGNVPAILLGLCLLAIAFYLVGPMPYFDSEASAAVDRGSSGRWALMCVALITLGLGLSLVYVPTVPLMFLSVGDLDPRLSVVVSHLFTSLMSFGQTLGPLFSSLLTEHHKFPWTAVIIGAILIAYVPLLLCVWRNDRRGHVSHTHVHAALSPIPTTDQEYVGLYEQRRH